MSKGSHRRPLNVSRKQFEENWEKVFSARKPKPKTEQECTCSPQGNKEVHLLGCRQTVKVG